ncbi:MAG: SpaA isopeptide-forming pilin-related protein, partial [Clostridia bacterium]|nr:SpaA isopeptide-forming pilin-related protein [Clostridia bacterium]
MKRKFAFLITFIVLLSLAVVTVSAKDNANVTTGEGVIMSIDTESFYTYPFHTGKTAKVHAGFVTSDDYSLGSPRHGTDGNTLWVYCLEFQVEGNTAALRYAAPPSTSTNHVWASLSDEQKLGITLATLYGYPMSGGNADDYFAATQCIIWEYQTGIRTSTKTNSRQAVNYTYKDGGTYSMYLSENYFASIMAQRASGTAAYNDLITKIYNHFKQPSFAGTKIELAYNAATGGYSKTLTDTNGVLSSYDVTCDSGVSVSVSGNNLTLTSSKYINGANLKLTKKTLPTTSQAMMILDPVSGQSMVTGQMNVPVSYSYKVYAQITGDLKVLKVDAGTGKGIPGAQFEVYDMSDNLIDTETSDESGVATFKKLKYGTYYAIESLAPTGYIRSEEKYVFSITQEGQVVSWECKDENLMRFFSVYKKGEVLTGFEENGDCFTPVYEEQYLSGAKVGIYAGEDIYTADGTRRYEKDELIETLETL